MQSDDNRIPSPRKELESYVARRLYVLQQSLLSSGGSQESAKRLAILRRTASKNPGATPEVWAIEFEGMPGSIAGRTDEPSSGEWAVHAAFTLYAVHQQSKTTPMYLSGYAYSFGAAVRNLVEHEGKANLAEGELPRRFAALATADSFAETLHYARQLVSQLRSASIPLDYARLAGQLYDFQNPYKADNVRLSWGREYARFSSKSIEENDNTKVESTPVGKEGN